MTSPPPAPGPPHELTFTGERLVPGQVDLGLLEEHVARYQWAIATLSRILPAGAPVLDIACGAGYGTHMLAQAGFDAIGVDIAVEAVAWAEKHFGSSRDSGLQLHYQAADVSSIPMESLGAQGIVAFEILEHLTDPAGLLSEIQRLLRPGGIALISTPNPDAHQIAGENEFHHHEYSEAEFRGLFAERFPGWPLALYGQVKGGVGGSASVAALRKGYIGLKRKLGIGPLVKKAIAPWTPGDDLRSMAHPYQFEAEQLRGVEYILAVLQRPG